MKKFLYIILFLPVFSFGQINTGLIAQNVQLILDGDSKIVHNNSNVPFGIEESQHSCLHKNQRGKLYTEHPELAPEQNARHDYLENFTRNYRESNISRLNQNILIPVVFHIVHDNGDENISETQIEEAILQLNEDFTAINPELVDLNPSFDSLVANVGFEFRLADLDPNGEPTSGINRLQSDLTYNGSNLALKEMIQWDPVMYLNIWVVYSSDGSNGSAFAYYPADVEGGGSIYDGIVCSYWAVGRTGTATPNYYKILTHEVGHWANLKHTWGDEIGFQASGGCMFDDGVEDTPNTIGNTGCNIESISCGSLDNVQNYMDYSYCTSMFSEGQKVRMLATMNSDVGGRNNIWSESNHNLVFINEDVLPRIIYNASTFEENDINDGSINGTISIELLDFSFTNTGNLSEGLDFNTSNCPEGTSIAINVIDAIHAEIIMTGQVANHAEIDAISNIEIHFTANSFDNITYEEIYNPSKINIELVFLDPYEIVFIDKVDDLHNFIEGTNWNWFSYGVGSADFGLWTYDKDNFKLEIYSNAGICYNGTRNLIPFEGGELIGPENTFTYYDGYPSQLDIYNDDYTEWAGKTAYAGVTFQLSGNQHYGWLRIKVNSDASEAWVMDMAYNEAPNQPIITGEVLAPVLSTSQNVFFESNDNDGSIRSIRNFDLHGSEFVDFESIAINNGFNISNLPSGLSAILNRVDSTTIQIELTGNATSHNASLIPITITIDPSLINGYLPNNLIFECSVKFEDPYQIVYQDVDDFTVSSTGNDWQWFSIGLTNYGLWFNNDHLRIETYGKSLVSLPNTDFVSSIGFGEQIQESLTWEYSAYCYECQPIVYSSNYTSWVGDTAYVGLKIPYQENFHYGWLRLSVTEDGSAMTLLDYAYNQAPNLPIATSQSGCTDNIAFNYNENANVDDGSCIAVVMGCIDELSFNYNLEANTDDDSCIAVVNGCMDDLALNYNPEANTDNNDLCFFDYDILGCMDSIANNYSEIATYDDGTCQYPGLSLNPVPTELCLGDTVLISWSGGNPSIAIFIGLANISTGYNAGQIDIVQNTGEYLWVVQNVPPGPGDTYRFYIETYLEPPTSWSHGSHFTICPIYGCTNIDAFNYNPSATFDDGTCLGAILGCTNSDACNYNEDAIQEDYSCELPVDTYNCFGECLYDANDDGVCEDVYYGCLDSLANNYNENVNEDDESCEYPVLSLNPVPTELCLGDTVLISWSGGNPYDEVKVKLINVTTNTSLGQIDIVENTGEYIWVVQNLPSGPGYIYKFNISEYPGPASSWSYSSHFTICPTYGCTNIEAFNYNPNATLDDGTCMGDILGCTNSDACNYNELANSDDGECQFSEEFYDCIGVCMNDVDIDGVCDELEVYGCIDIEASNYNNEATESNSSCEYICTVPSSWEYVITGVNHTLMIPVDVSIQVNGADIALGSTIGVFYTNDSGDLQCAGYTSVTGEITFIAVMGDDSTTDEIDGLLSGDELVWMAWDINTCEQYELSANYSSGSSTFIPNDLTFLESLNHYTCQSIAFPGGWYMYSSYIQAEDMDAEQVMSSIEENLVILKDNEGNAYLTEWDFNGIGELDFREGYQIKTNTLDTIDICGLQKYPEANPLFISQGWNLISYLRESPSPVDVVLEDMNSTGNLLLVKDFNGNPYLPEWNFNGIGDMQPGQGYQLKALELDTLFYLSNDLDYRVSTSRVINSKLKHFDRPLNTGNNMQIVIPENVWESTVEEGSEISAYNAVGKLVGATVYSNPTTVLTLWGNDVNTELVDGLLVNEPVALKVWNNERLRDFEITNWSIGANSYEIDAVNVVSSIDFSPDYALTSLFDAIPNPSYQTTNISFFIIESTKVNISVYTILGELMEVIANSKYTEGLHEIEMNVSHLEAGSYFYTMTTADFKQTNQLIILKE